MTTCGLLALFLAAAARMGVLAHQASLGAAGQSRELALEKAWSHELSSQTESPIKRVVGLLQKMKSELEEEANKEAEMYDKMVCWCETNEKEKTKAIADAEARDKELVAEIQSRSAKFGEVATEVDALKKQIAEDTASLKEAEALREKENAAFMAEEKDLVQAVANLKNAIAVLSKHHSFLQIDAPLLSGLRVMLRDTALKYEMLMAGSHRAAPSQKTAFLSVAAGQEAEQSSASRALLSALNIHGSAVVDMPLKFAERVVAQSAKGHVATKQAQGTFLQASEQQPSATGKEGSYQAQSTAIFGIMNQMQSDMEAELSRSQKDEVAAQQAFDALKLAKSDQIALGKKKLDEYESGHAANSKALADAKEDLELTRAQRSEDVEFLRNLKLQCDDLDHKWEQR